jgi:hypothetical protein
VALAPLSGPAVLPNGLASQIKAKLAEALTAQESSPHLVFKKAMRAKDGIAVVELLRANGTRPAEWVKAGVWALRVLAVSHVSKTKLGKAGACEAVVDVLLRRLSGFARRLGTSPREMLCAKSSLARLGM